MFKEFCYFGRFISVFVSLFLVVVFCFCFDLQADLPNDQLQRAKKSLGLIPQITPFLERCNMSPTVHCKIETKSVKKMKAMYIFIL